jgi:hypothetical protein
MAALSAELAVDEARLAATMAQLATKMTHLAVNMEQVAADPAKVAAYAAAWAVRWLRLGGDSATDGGQYASSGGDCRSGPQARSARGSSRSALVSASWADAVGYVDLRAEASLWASAYFRRA